VGGQPSCQGERALYSASGRRWPASGECYSLGVELEKAPEQRAWAYRKAASAIEDTEQVLAPIYRAMGPLREGLESIENAGPRMAEVVEGPIEGLSGVQMCATMPSESGCSYQNASAAWAVSLVQVAPGDGKRKR
jgi:hypothetical protein